MIDHPLSGIRAWVDYFSSSTPPVLQRTISELEQLKAREDDITGRDFSHIILHDPLMTLRVLHYLQTHKGRSDRADITTIAHALMMVGTSPFFRYFSDLQPLQTTLEGWPAACDGLLAVMSRARHAALLAREWSYYRHDIESDEVFIAALLHDLAEMLMWAHAPGLMLTVRTLLLNNRQLRSSEAQRQIFGFAFDELQLELARAWKLPGLLIELMDASRREQPRVQNVLLACDMARHLANGWDDAALPDDYAGARKLLALGEHEIRETIVRAAIHAARDWSWYNVRPALALRPASTY